MELGQDLLVWMTNLLCSSYTSVDPIPHFGLLTDGYAPSPMVIHMPSAKIQAMYKRVLKTMNIGTM